jgi:hypothetical protein
MRNKSFAKRYWDSLTDSRLLDEARPVIRTRKGYALRHRYWAALTDTHLNPMPWRQTKSTPPQIPATIPAVESDVMIDNAASEIIIASLQEMFLRLASPNPRMTGFEK